MKQKKKKKETKTEEKDRYPEKIHWFKLNHC